MKVFHSLVKNTASVTEVQWFVMATYLCVVGLPIITQTLDHCLRGLCTHYPWLHCLFLKENSNGSASFSVAFEPKSGLGCLF
jgi:hypothetical protein